MNSRQLEFKSLSKISPVNHTSKLLDLCRSNMKANRANCIQQLRTSDRKEVAANILDSLSKMNSKERGSTSASISTNSIYKDDNDNDDDIRHYIENEDYAYLLNQIMNELDDPYYYEDVEDELQEYHTNEDDDTTLLCPLCKIQFATLNSDSYLTCSCGLFIPLTKTSIPQLKEILADVFSRHYQWSQTTKGSKCHTGGTSVFPLQFTQSGFASLCSTCTRCGFVDSSVSIPC
jgi:Replication protein A interacting C-terminal